MLDLVNLSRYFLVAAVRALCVSNFIPGYLPKGSTDLESRTPNFLASGYIEGRIWRLECWSFSIDTLVLFPVRQRMDADG